MNVFNRRVVRMHRDRAATQFAEHDFLFREIAERLLERLNDVTRRFPRALDIGGRTGLVSELIGARGDVEYLVCCELSERMVQQAVHTNPAASHAWAVADEETLPFAAQSFDLVTSNLSLHWVNDLPGALSQIRAALRPDGLLIASMLGGETLRELRSALSEAEIAVEGGLSPRISPFADIRDVGALLQRAGFALPVVDMETITVSYGDPMKLLADLRGMGETNAVIERRLSTMRRETLMRAMQIYQDKYADAEGRMPATFQILYLSGWAPAPGQQQPMKPGTADRSFSEIFGNDE